MSIQPGFHHADCMDWLPEMADDYVDLAIVDPPYGIGDTFIGYSSGEVTGKLERKHKPVDWDDNMPNDKYFQQLCRISKKRIIWGANYFNCFEDGGALIWYKNRGGLTLSQCEIASVSGQKKVDYIYHQVLSGFIKNNEDRIHQMQKPIFLYRYILGHYANKSDLILDTHVGSGSSLIACEREGFEYIGYEIDEDYYRDATERIEKYREQLKQTTLF